MAKVIYEGECIDRGEKVRVVDDEAGWLRAEHVQGSDAMGGLRWAPINEDMFRTEVLIVGVYQMLVDGVPGEEAQP